MGQPWALFQHPRAGAGGVSGDRLLRRRRRELNRDLEVVRLPLEIALAIVDFLRDPRSHVIHDDYSIAWLLRHRGQDRNNIRRVIRVVNEHVPAHGLRFYTFERARAA